MKQVNRRLYECDDCHAKYFVTWVELNRASKPKCQACGCTRLELVSEEAKRDRSRLQAERVYGTGGSLKLSSYSEDTKHKIVR